MLRLCLVLKQLPDVITVRVTKMSAFCLINVLSCARNVSTMRDKNTFVDIILSLFRNQFSK